MQAEIGRKGGWLSREEGDTRNKQGAHLFSALAGAIGNENPEVLGRMKELSYGVRASPAFSGLEPRMGGEGKPVGRWRRQVCCEGWKWGAPDRFQSAVFWMLHFLACVQAVVNRSLLPFQRSLLLPVSFLLFKLSSQGDTAEKTEPSSSQRQAVERGAAVGRRLYQRDSG